MHALLVKHTDKRHGVNGSLCHVDHEIWQRCVAHCCNGSSPAGNTDLLRVWFGSLWILVPKNMGVD